VTLYFWFCDGTGLFPREARGWWVGSYGPFHTYADALEAYELGLVLPDQEESEHV
jgi:hypothetical protein